jgi:hypothetical protein
MVKVNTVGYTVSTSTRALPRMEMGLFRPPMHKQYITLVAPARAESHADTMKSQYFTP